MPLYPLLYSLERACPVKWNETTENKLHQDYPFVDQEESDEDFVIRRYLETLWLPQSFNPLSYLVFSLRRVSHTHEDTSNQPLPLHSLLQPLLLSPRVCSEKYRKELAQILENGGGAGEQEETMMWFAWEHEKLHEGEGEVDGSAWQKGWMERLEQRETMIQILLHMLMLSLPKPELSASDKSPKALRKQNEIELPSELIKERLESYMDKLSMWQLTSSLDDADSCTAKVKAEKHWTQAFHEDVVEPLFNVELPSQCELLRSKIFAKSPFSDSGDSDEEGASIATGSRHTSRAPSVSSAPLPGIPSVPVSMKTRREMQRSRSRSLSVSLVEDEVRRHANIIGRKRALSREVSMSRVFKEKPKLHANSKPGASDVERKTKHKERTTKCDVDVTLVKETPVKRRRADLVLGEQDIRNYCGHLSYHAAAALSSITRPILMEGERVEDTPVATRKYRSTKTNG